MKQRSWNRGLIDLMFREFKLYRFYEKDQPVDGANVWLGTKSKIDLVLEEPLHLVMARSDRRKMKVSVNWNDLCRRPSLPDSRSERLCWNFFRQDDIPAAGG